jgi:phosphopantothenoylcysteine decarboxylase/phosphopantothenate--cysteine ligase
MVVVAPASADILAKMAAGMGNDLATTALLATNKPVIVAPAMNVQMWNHPATQRNVKQLQADGITVLMPESGDLACGEVGAGRMMEPSAILAGILNLESGIKKLQGRRILITAGPTHEPIDPVRYIGNHSSGKQGIAIAAALVNQGAEVHLILGPTAENPPANVHTTRVTTAQEMLAACEKTLPVDVAICAAAVADWTIDHPAMRKMKKRDSGEAPKLSLTQNPDILAILSQHKKHRPTLVIGFAAETENLEKNAREKLAKKGCDWLLANDVSGDNVFGKDTNSVLFFDDKKMPESWQGSKHEIAEKLVEKVLGFSC